jgi:hypothetical protein
MRFNSLKTNDGGPSKSPPKHGFLKKSEGPTRTFVLRSERCRLSLPLGRPKDLLWFEGPTREFHREHGGTQRPQRIAEWDVKPLGSGATQSVAPGPELQEVSRMSSTGERYVAVETATCKASEFFRKL